MKDQNPKWEVGKPLVIALAMSLGILLGAKLFGEQERERIGWMRQEKNNFSMEVLRYIDAHYVDSVDISYINEKAIRAMLEGLDPHTTYLSPLELESVNMKMRGQYKGIGIEFLILKDTLCVTKVLKGSSAEKAQLKIGDQLISFDGLALSGSDAHPELSSHKLLMSASDTLQLVLKREGSLVHKTLVRKPVEVSTVSISQALSDSVHYLKIESFNSETYREFMQALEAAVTNNRIPHLIIDVRDNPGGYLDAVVKIVSQLFSEKGKMIVFTEGLGSGRKEFLTSGKNFFSIGTISVLVNEFSASASEILAGALQDNERGKIIGRKTYGKGLVQDQYPLSNGGAIRLTVARFYTPSGRSIQKKFDVDGKNFASVEGTIPKVKEEEEEHYSGGIEPDVWIDKWAFEEIFEREVEKENFFLDLLFLYNLQEKLSFKEYAELKSWVETFEPADSQGFSSDFKQWLRGAYSIPFRAMLLRKITSMHLGEEEAVQKLWQSDPYIKTAVDLL
jgi:carboxyl-terminal processing protease